MDFFTAQERARRRSRVMAGLFGLAIVAIVLLLYLPLNFLVGATTRGFDLHLLALVAGPVSLFILAGSWWRMRALRAGGPTVAASLGGRRVMPSTTDPAERRLMNIVEEMGLASGVPVPAVFVLDREEGINAFAAGYSIHDAAVAVTRGCLERLDREELQGVIAHEFSHILNGDMRLNIKMVGLLHGILLLTIVGRGILHGSTRSRRRATFGRGGKNDGAMAGIAAGLALLVVGYLGVFFGKLIKSAFSREREYLADAAAVQFTRSPHGIAGALKKISMLHPGSVIHDPHAEELSHLFFARGLRETWLTFFKTHPPVQERIRRVDPAWDGRYDVKVPRIMKERAEAARQGRVPGDGVPPMARLGLPAAAVMASIGAPAAVHLAYARDLLERIPDTLRHAAHDETGAQALVFALLLDHQAGPVRARQLEGVVEYGGDGFSLRTQAMEAAAAEAGADARLAILDLALPALQALDEDRAARFRATAQRLIREDARVRMFDYALVHILERHLPPGRDRAHDHGAWIHSFQPLRADVEVVLSATAHSGTTSIREAQAAFDAAARRLPDAALPISLRPADAVDMATVDRALQQLERSALGVRRRFLDACAHCVAFDGQILAEEAETLRAVAEALDCPMPPIAAGAPDPVAA
jgi:Zn-dependent protease with chaperone function